MAYEFYVTIEGTKQGRLKGESLRKPHEGKLAGIGYSYEVKSPRDAASGQASGKRQHGPVSFTKPWGAASPQLFQAFVTNEVLKSALFEFMRVNANGEEEVFQTVKLTNASVTSIRQHIDPDGLAEALPELEEIALVFQTIEIENTIGKTTATDSWLSSR